MVHHTTSPARVAHGRRIAATLERDERGRFVAREGSRRSPARRSHESARRSPARRSHEGARRSPARKHHKRSTSPVRVVRLF